MSFQYNTGSAAQYWLLSPRIDLRSVSLPSFWPHSGDTPPSLATAACWPSPSPLLCHSLSTNWRNSKSSKRLVLNSSASTFYRHTHAQMDRDGEGKTEADEQMGETNKQTDNVPQWHAEEDHSVCQTMFAVWNTLFFNASPEKTFHTYHLFGSYWL